MKHQNTVRTTCPYCGVGCGVLATAQADGTVKIVGDPDHPANFGRLCSKGLALGETFAAARRLMRPRVHGEDASWDNATALVAQKFSDAIREFGPESVAFYVSGQLLTEDYYVANKLMKGFIGSANIDTNSRLCMASAVAGHKRAFGADIVPCSYSDLEEAELVVLVGSNLAWCHPVLFQRLLAAREKHGTKIVVIDPRRTITAESADVHLQIKPGADVSLFNGLLRHLYGRDAFDGRFVFARTNGLAHALIAAQTHDDATVTAHTGLSFDDLQGFYGLFARYSKTVTGFSMGVNQAIDGTDKVNAIINCHLLTGRIGKPGAGPFSITGQPNAMGGREVGGLANMLAAHMDFANEAHRDAVQAFWRSPRMASQPGLKAVEMFEAVEAGRVKALWIMATNPVVSMPNSSAITSALAQCPFVVVSDVTADTDTARFADVLLPARGWGEKDGTVTNSERRISRQRQFSEPVGEARADWRIVCDVARAMDFDGFEYESAADIFAEHVQLTMLGNNGTRRLNLSAWQSQSYDDMPPQQWGSAQAFSDGRFETPDGKARFVTTVFAPQNSDQITLNTGRIRDQWHTMTRTGLVAKLFGHRAEPYIELHPSDALQLGLQDAELAVVSGVAGASVVRVMVTDAVCTGSAFQPMHWNSGFAAHGMVNAATVGKVDPVSGQPALKSAQVSVRKFEARWYGFGVALKVDPTGLDYWAKRPLSCGVSLECAGLALPKSWNDLVSQLFDLRVNSDLSTVQSSDPAEVRFVSLRDGVLEFAFFASSAPVSASRSWLQGLVGKPVSALDVLAARTAGGHIDQGPIVCACNGVGRFAILNAAESTPGLNLQALCEVTGAGMGCGSCRPEVQKILVNRPQFAVAAE